MLLIQGARVGLLRLRGDHAGDSGYAHDDLEVGMYCVYRNDNQGVGPSPSQCPIRLGQIMRIIDEDSEPFAMISAWWPVLKPRTIWISLLLLDLHFSILCDLARMCGAYWVIELPISSLFFKTQHRVPRFRRVSEVPSETARVQASKRKPYKDVRRRTLISARSAPCALVCHDARMPSSSQRYGVRRIDGYGRWHA